jgi:hypothetical protein
MAEVGKLRPVVRTFVRLGRIQQCSQSGSLTAEIAAMNHLSAQLPSWMSRLVARPPTMPPSSLLHTRVEVCPPELWPSSLSWRGRLQRLSNHLVRRATPLLPVAARPVNRLALVKAEFLSSLADLHDRPDLSVQRLQDRIERARSLRELWHLRSEVYGTVATILTQSDADLRLATLNRHFPVRAARPA